MDGMRQAETLEKQQILGLHATQTRPNIHWMKHKFKTQQRKLRSLSPDGFLGMNVKPDLNSSVAVLLFLPGCVSIKLATPPLPWTE